MQEITIEKVMEKAKAFQKEGKKWHFHMLTPDCMFNQRKDKQAFILENQSDGEVFVVYSDKRYMEEGQTLVKMLHGEKIVGQEAGSQEEHPNLKIIIEKAKRFNEQGIHWHHHTLFPECIFNKHKGKWCLVFEDKEEGKVIEATYDDEPKQDLSKIEVLYYAQKE